MNIEEKIRQQINSLEHRILKDGDPEIPDMPTLRERVEVMHARLERVKRDPMFRQRLERLEGLR